VARTRGVPLGNVNKTLEDVVKELLRPMLKDWLDVNLPPLVERIVEKEIVKLVGRAEDD
jgi:cell pole-organizing protein PopZ